MADHLSAEERSRNMSRIRGKHTGPEMKVRKFLHASGLRFRLHAAHLPGNPDIILPRRSLAIFVNGCFWHGCPHCGAGSRIPKTNVPYWTAKLHSNRERDRKAIAELELKGWRAEVVWACQLKSREFLPALLATITEQ